MKKNVFNSMMEFTTTKFDNFYVATNSSIPCYLQQVACIGWVASYEDPKDLSICDDGIAPCRFSELKVCTPWCSKCPSSTLEAPP